MLLYICYSEATVRNYYSKAVFAFNQHWLGKAMLLQVLNGKLITTQ